MTCSHGLMTATTNRFSPQVVRCFGIAEYNYLMTEKEIRLTFFSLSVWCGYCVGRATNLDAPCRGSQHTVRNLKRVCVLNPDASYEMRARNLFAGREGNRLGDLIKGRF